MKNEFPSHAMDEKRKIEAYSRSDLFPALCHLVQVSVFCARLTRGSTGSDKNLEAGQNMSAFSHAMRRRILQDMG
jgi:hypothetical protein